MVVPALFTKNISFVMTLSKRLSIMIDGIIQQVENTLKMG
jgi:ABC-type sugar transport system ATPase subunit